MNHSRETENSEFRRGNTAEFCGISRNFVSGIPLERSLFKIPSNSAVVNANSDGSSELWKWKYAAKFRTEEIPWTHYPTCHVQYGRLCVTAGRKGGAGTFDLMLLTSGGRGGSAL